MKLPAYDQYKESGSEWCEPIPSHWSIEPLKYNSYVKGRIGWQNLRSEEFTDEGPFLITGMHFKDGSVDWDQCYHITEERFAIAPEIQVRPNDVLITKDGSIGKLAHLRELPGQASLNSHLLVIRPLRERYIPRYLYLLLSSFAFRYHIELHQSGTTFFGITQESVVKFGVILPPIPEQQDIAEFLDQQTARLDTLVDKKLKLIKRLKEKRSALISHTTTRGLNFKGKLKKSGNTWLGDVPSHWEVLTVRRRAKLIKTGGTPPTAEERYYEDGTVPWFGPGSFDDQIVVSQPVKLLNSSAVKEGAARMFAAGATMVVAIGATLGKVSSLTAPGSCNQQITVIEFEKCRVHPRFATYQLKRLEPALRAIAPSATLPILDQGEIADIAIGLPPIPEQTAITEFLDVETAKIDDLVAKVETAVERLQEYRTALITAAVTGKIDVRKAVA